MTIQKHMFGLVEDWRKSGQPQVSFLEKHGITQAKFSYWVNKYNKQKVNRSVEKPVKLKSVNPNGKHSPDFMEIVMPIEAQLASVDKIFELTTPSGIQITVFG